MNFSQIEREVEFQAVRSRGPGGQNVNKVSSAAFLTWDYRSSLGLNANEKFLVGEKLEGTINSEGFFYIRADEFRDLERNRSRCLEKLEAMLKQALHRPKPRKATKPTRGSKERKLKDKSRRSEIKKLRRDQW